MHIRLQVQNPYRTILQPAYRPQLFVAITATFFQQWTGINTIVFCAPSLAARCSPSWCRLAVSLGHLAGHGRTRVSGRLTEHKSLCATYVVITATFFQQWTGVNTMVVCAACFSALQLEPCTPDPIALTAGDFTVWPEHVVLHSLTGGASASTVCIIPSASEMRIVPATSFQQSTGINTLALNFFGVVVRPAAVLAAFKDSVQACYTSPDPNGSATTQSMCSVSQPKGHWASGVRLGCRHRIWKRMTCLHLTLGLLAHVGGQSAGGQLTIPAVRTAATVCLP